MKTVSLVLACGGLLLLCGSPLQSQQPATAPRTAAQTLQDMRAQNQRLIEQQTATLQKLDELEKAAAQLRVFARRS